MIAALVAAWWWACRWTGAYVLGCAAIALAVIGIGLLRAFWRDWRTPRCRYCNAALPADWRPRPMLVEWSGPVRRGVQLCDHDAFAWINRHDRLPREVMG